MKTRLINILYDLEETRLNQEQKNQYYNNICKLRSKHNLTPKSVDSIGFNLLHWAVLCNQDENVITQLIDNGIDVNSASEPVEGIGMSGITPLRFTIQTDNEKLANVLLQKGANKNAKYQDSYEFQTLSTSYTETFDIKNADYAFRKANSTYKFFEKDLANQYYNNRARDQRNCHTDYLPDCVITFFGGYLRQSKLDAANAYKKLLEVPHDKQDATWRNNLKNLKEQHPAVNEGKLGEYYQASLRSRRM